MERLQKVIADSGLCSRRKAEKLMLEGKVKVNGEVVKTLGTKVDASAEIIVNDKPLLHVENEYYVLYKPEGYISTTDDEKGRQTVVDLVPTQARIYPVGRLDYDASGVLLLTNDGAFNQAMIHPKHKIEKEYQVTVKGLLRKETSAKLSRGIHIDGKKTARAKIRNVEYNTEKMTTRCHIIITEGRYHQVKKMFERVEHPVLKLKRVRFGIITLKGLKKGEVRRLKPHELKQLYVLSKQ